MSTNKEDLLPQRIAAGVIFMSIFLPWGQLMGFGLSGWDVIQLGSFGSLAGLIPLAALMALTLSVSPSRDVRMKVNIIAGALPTLGLLTVIQQLSRDILHVVGIGVYVAILAGWTLLYFTLTNQRAPQSEVREATT